MDRLRATVTVGDDEREVDVEAYFDFEAGERATWNYPGSSDSADFDETMYVLNERGGRTGETLNFSDLSESEQERLVEEAIGEAHENSAAARAEAYWEDRESF